MRAFAVLAVAVFAAACSPQHSDDPGVDLGPMPTVAAFNDSGPMPANATEREAFFTRELNDALTANAATETPLDFDFRSWANDPEVVNIKYATGMHPPEGRQIVSTRFTYSVGGGMIVEYTLCRRGPSDWLIEDIRGQPVPDEGQPAPEDPTPSVREMLEMAPSAANAPCV